MKSTMRAPPVPASPPVTCRLTIACGAASGATSLRSIQTSSVEPPPMSKTSTWLARSRRPAARRRSPPAAPPPRGGSLRAAGRFRGSTMARKWLPLRARRQASVATSRTFADLIAAELLGADLERRQGARDRAARQMPGALKARAEPHRFGEGVDHAEMAALGGCDQHPAAVGAQIEGRVQLRIRPAQARKLRRLGASATVSCATGQVVRH